MTGFVLYVSQLSAQLKHILINSLPNDKCFYLTNLKACADEKINIAKIMISVFDIAENIVGKGENACISIFSFSHAVSKAFFSRVIKTRDCVVKS